MKKLTKLKRHFLAALPVLDPHQGIERQLLLAEKKPIGIFTILIGSKSPETQEKLQDIEILNRAVATGQLCSIQKKDNNYIYYYYCQPGKTDDLLAFLEEEKQNVLKAERLGYRTRDVIFFEIFRNLPSTVRELIREWNAPANRAYQEELLERHEINT